ncbi:MAG: alpha/beta fold hydrolase [Sandaracinaceae bacterium]|jgi:3-oxoadipate enol-lactonase|nr:alpha/beta fold hydrolase [Sandaracinaceae bacterium]
MTLSFSFIDDGDAQAVPVVFLHAFPYHSGMWEAQREGLKGHARFIAFDVQGAGTRSQDGTAYMLEHVVDDWLALLDHLEIETCVLAGLSMGGYVALRAVARAPERVRGLILANTQAGADSDTAKLGRAEGLRVLRRGGAAAFVAAQIAKQLSPHTQATLPALSKQLLSLASGATEGGVAASLVAIATRSDHTASLRDIAVPTLLIAGADDVVTPPALLQVLADHIPGATLHVLAGAGHLSNLEAEAEFTRLVIAFLAELA